MARRGEELREHILWQAKDVFLELGFERASMDVVAARAETSKRSLYAHYENKEKLFLAVVDFVRDRLRGRLKPPGDYSAEPEAALVEFCGRYLQILWYEKSIQMVRLCIAEMARFPDASARYFSIMFDEVEARLAAYLEDALALPPADARNAAQRLLGRLLYPRLPRALFGLDRLAQTMPDDLAPDADLTEVRAAVAELQREIRAR